MKLTDRELCKLRDAYNVQKKTQTRRRPDRNGHRIQVIMTFEEWLQVWIDSGKLHLRGNGRGKFCMGRKNDLVGRAALCVDTTSTGASRRRPRRVELSARVSLEVASRSERAPLLLPLASRRKHSLTAARERLQQ